MDLKEIKKLTNFARRAGMKSIEVDGLKIEFKDEIIVSKPRGRRLTPVPTEKPAVEPPKLPTLDDINQYIYGQTDEAS